ncbi:3-demethylubiquinone-9 3-methyltransferase [compost metagenome]
MTTINPYLYFDGNCEEAFTFYKSVFKSEFKYIGRYKDVPEADRRLFSDHEDKIMHVSLPISKETILMGSDNAELFQQNVSLTNFSLSVNTDQKEEADRLFQGLAVGGKIKLPMNNTFWGSYYGIVTDKFGINWKISCEPV